MKKEIWKNIPNYEGYYQVSNLGQVKSLKRLIVYKDGRKYLYNNRILKKTLTPKKYEKVILSINNIHRTKKVHRLVGLTFIPNLKNKPQINHKDGNKLNNHVDNLEWCTNSENQLHSIKTGLRKIIIGKNNHANKSIGKYDLNNVFICEYYSLRNAAFMNNIKSPGNIRMCAIGKYSHASGFIWKYIN